MSHKSEEQWEPDTCPVCDATIYSMGETRWHECDDNFDAFNFESILRGAGYGQEQRSRSNS